MLLLSRQAQQKTTSASRRMAPISVAFFLPCRHISLPDMSGPIKIAEKKDVPFSQSAAYYGRDRIFDPSLHIPVYMPSYYDSQRFKNIQLLSIVLSVTALYAYLLGFREPRDLDQLYDMDPRLININMRKQAIKDRMESMHLKGMDTRELELEMLEMLAMEAEVKVLMAKNSRNAQVPRDGGSTPQKTAEDQTPRKRRSRLSRDDEPEVAEKGWVLAG